jgi:hypothetical protein
MLIGKLVFCFFFLPLFLSITFVFLSMFPFLINFFLLLFQDLGIPKVGHMKRILQGIKELERNPPNLV